jgi:hypothetical protein
VTRARKPVRSIHPRRRQRGAATVEFVLAFPVLLFLVLTLVQVTLLMVGNVFVHYSAYAATRAAASQVPADLQGTGGEPRNLIVPSRYSPKFEAIERAAWFAVTPVAGRSAEQADVDADGFASDVRAYLRATGRGQPNWAGTLLADRLRYAATHTRVTMMTTEVEGDEVVFRPLSPMRLHTFGPLDPITVEVEHDLFLSIPYVWRMFADGERGGVGNGGGYTTVRARYTMSNEGIDPAMPAPPGLPRVDP